MVFGPKIQIILCFPLLTKAFRWASVRWKQIIIICLVNNYVKNTFEAIKILYCFIKILYFFYILSVMVILLKRNCKQLVSV